MKGNLGTLSCKLSKIFKGQFWKGFLGGGYITGISKCGQITGNDFAFILPNLEGI